MNIINQAKEVIEAVLNKSGFGILATEGNGQPHMSLIAITPFGNSRQIVFATNRNTLKYRNLSGNNKVAVLIEGKYNSFKGLEENVVLTIIGQTEEISKSDNDTFYEAHLKRHPGMESFMLSPDCVLILVNAISYQLVYGIDDTKWITAEELDSTRP